MDYFIWLQRPRFSVASCLPQIAHGQSLQRKSDCGNACQWLDPHPQRSGWMMSFQALKKKKSRGRIILLSQCSQTPESHYDNLVLLNLHLQFHLKNPLCFLPCKVEVRTESGQGPSARKREAEKVNILPRKEARLPCWVVRKQRQQNSSSFRKTDLRDSCRSVPG